MANEDQTMNDHHLHIEPCLCGNPAPEVSGDDFDGSVDCDQCQRETYGYGTRGAINIWNRKTSEHKNGVAEFPRSYPLSFFDADQTAEKMLEEAEEFDKAFPTVAQILKDASAAITAATTHARRELCASEPPFKPAGP